MAGAVLAGAGVVAVAPPNVKPVKAAGAFGAPVDTDTTRRCLSTPRKSPEDAGAPFVAGAAGAGIENTPGPMLPGAGCCCAAPVPPEPVVVLGPGRGSALG